MSFLDRIDSMLSEKGANKNQMAAATGIPVSTIYSWYKKGFDGIALPTLRKLCEYFGCTLEWLVNGEEAKSPLSSEALDLARKYDAIGDEHARNVIRTVVNLEYEHHARPNTLPTSEWLLAHAINAPDAEDQAHSG